MKRLAKVNLHRKGNSESRRNGGKPYSNVFCQPKGTVICRRVYKKWDLPGIANKIVHDEKLWKRPEAMGQAKAYLSSRLKLDLFKMVGRQNRPFISDGEKSKALLRDEGKLKALLNSTAVVAKNAWQHYDGNMPRQTAIETHAAAANIAAIIARRTQLSAKRDNWRMVAKAHDLERDELAISKKGKIGRVDRQDMVFVLNNALVEADILRAKCRRMISVGCREINRIVEKAFKEQRNRKQQQGD